MNSTRAADCVNPVTVKDVWAMVPDLACKGLCVASCGPIGMTKAEHEILSERIGEPMLTTAEAIEAYQDDPTGYFCPLLVDGRCVEHAHRPLVCRLYGVEETMTCRFGCVPEGGHMSHREGSSLMQLMLRVGRGPA